VPQQFCLAIPSVLAIAGFLAFSTEDLAARSGHCVACDGKAIKHLSSSARHANDAPRDRARHERRSGGNDHSFSGLASYYAERQRLASDRAYNAAALTAAHRTLPFGTRVQVSDPKSGRSVIVTINDRGPFVRGRVLDLSPAAARALGMIGRGVMPIKASVQ
jgi:rare lipoprotein A